MNKVLPRIVMPDFDERELQPPRRGRKFLSRFVKQSQNGFDSLLGVVNTGAQGVGPAIPSAAAIAVNSAVHHISGAQTINTITPSPGHSGPVWLVADGAFSLGNAGNISLPVGPLTPGQAIRITYDDVLQKWYPEAPVTSSSVGSTVTDGTTINGNGSNVSPVTLILPVGPIAFRVTNTSAQPYAIVGNDVFIGANSSAGADQTINLPNATGSGRFLIIKKMDANAHNIVITRAGADLIDGATTSTITIQYDTVRLMDVAAGVWAII